MDIFDFELKERNLSFDTAYCLLTNLFGPTLYDVIKMHDSTACMNGRKEFMLYSQFGCKLTECS